VGTNFEQAVQAQGIVATAKHFVANTQDENRKNRNEVIGERALRESYLYGSRKVLLEGDVGAVMGAYNRVNGTFCTETLTFSRTYSGTIGAGTATSSPTTVPSTGRLTRR
jgi:beta-glucosidase